MYDTLVEPVLPCPGNKVKLMEKLLPHFPTDIRIFFDTMCGTGSVFLNVESEITCINDNNVSLIALLTSLTAEHPEIILDKLDAGAKEYDLTKETDYYKLRKHFNQTKNPLALFLLISASYGNMIRFNRKGEFNAPYSKDRWYTRQKYSDKVYQFHERMKLKGDNVFFMSKHVSKIPTKLISGGLTEKDFFYADPPYLISTHPWVWTKEDERKLLKKLCIIHNRGAKFALSNWLQTKNKHNDILSSWINKNSFRVIDINTDYDNSFNKNGTRKRHNREVLVVNYE